MDFAFRFTEKIVITHLIDILKASQWGLGALYSSNIEPKVRLSRY